MFSHDDIRAAFRPSPRLWRLRMVQVGVITVLALGLAISVGVGIGSDTVLATLLIATVAAAAVALVLSRRRFLAWAYTERDQDLVVSRGVMFRRQSVVPYGRMQFVDVTAGPFERAFGIATVKLHTAAAASDARIPGLASAEAARLRDRLAALGEARASGL